MSDHDAVEPVITMAWRAQEAAMNIDGKPADAAEEVVMLRPQEGEVNPDEFESKLSECSEALQQIVGYLRATASHSGADVTYRRFKHPAPNSGWGIGFYAVGGRFCEVHPKAKADVAWLFLRSADSGPVKADGLEPSEQPGWFKVRTMGEAVRAVKWILAAHAAGG